MSYDYEQIEFLKIIPKVRRIVFNNKELNESNAYTASDADEAYGHYVNVLKQ